LEVLQLLDLTLNGRPHALVFFFAFFVLLPSVIARIKASKYEPYASNFQAKVSAIVPVYKEDPNIFERCLRSIRPQVDEIIVVCDVNRELAELSKRLGCKVIFNPERRGKRVAIKQGVAEAKNDFILLVDSDTLLSPNTVSELLKPMKDPKIAGVASVHNVARAKSYVSWVLTTIIEKMRRNVDMSMNGNLVVVDGRCNLWRKSYLVSVVDELVNETFMGKPCQIGDDRFLTRMAHKKGLKTVVQTTAIVTTTAPETFRSFLKQQLRWYRSGRKYFLLDILERNIPSAWYFYHLFCYYTSSIFLLMAIVMDHLFFGLEQDCLMWISLVGAVAGPSLVTAIRQVIRLHYTDIKYSVICGLVGLYIMLPLSLYAWLTMGKQSIWGTR